MSTQPFDVTDVPGLGEVTSVDLGGLVITTATPIVSGPPGPPGPRGEKGEKGDAADVLAELEPPVDLTVLYENRKV